MSNVQAYAQFRATTSRYFQNVSRAMIAALRDPALAQIDVRFRGAHVNAVSFRKVRHVLETGQVLAFYNADPQFAGAGKTVHEYDTVFVGFNSTATLWNRSGFVHEAVHVRADIRGHPRREMADEVLAYIVQAVFLRFGGLQTNNYTGVRNSTLLPAALSVADTLLVGNQVTHQQEAALEASIRALPEYRNTDIAHSVLHYDRIHRARR